MIYGNSKMMFAQTRRWLHVLKIHHEIKCRSNWRIRKKRVTEEDEGIEIFSLKIRGTRYLLQWVGYFKRFLKHNVKTAWNLCGKNPRRSVSKLHKQNDRLVWQLLSHTRSERQTPEPSRNIRPLIYQCWRILRKPETV